MLENVFHLKENHTDAKTEIMAGITTFMTMAYILAVNPNILSASGMDSEAVLIATALASFVGTALMALLANYPFALAPGMGLNAYFSYTVVLTMGYSWQLALMAVFVEGIIFIALSLTNVREGIFNAIPMTLKSAVSVGIGLFVAFVGLQNAKLIVNSQSVSSSSTNNTEGSEPNVIPSITAKPQDQILVSVDITNTGDVYGKEVVQLYVKNAACDAIRPKQELRNFAKIGLEPGETKTVTLELDARSFAYYNTQIHDWYAPSGDYELLLSASSRDVRQRLTLHLENDQKLPFIVTDITSCGDVYDHADDPSPLDDLMVKSGFIESAGKENDSMGGGTAMMMRAMYNDTPLHSILSFSTDQLTWEDIQETIRAINEKQS